MHTVLSQPTAPYAAMLWEGEDDASDDTDQPTAFQAAMTWQCNDSSSSSSHMGSPTGFDAAALYLSFKWFIPYLYMFIYRVQSPRW